MAQAESPKAASRAWLRREQKAGSRAARPVLMWHVIGSAAAIGQAFAAATVLAAAFTGSLPDAPALATLGVLAAAPAGPRGAGGGVRRGGPPAPAWRRGRISGAPAPIGGDKRGARAGLFSRYARATASAMVGPAIVLLAVLYADPWAALLLLGCGI